MYPLRFAVFLSLLAGFIGGADLSARVSFSEVDGGTIAGNEADTLYLCPGSLDGGLIDFTTTSTRRGDDYFYVITTATDEPVVIAILDSASFDFGPVNLEEIRVYGIGYTGNLAVVVGFPITLMPLSDDCFELSDNFVTILKTNPIAVDISTANGAAELTISTDSPALSSVVFQLETDRSANQVLVLTDTNNTVLMLVEGDTIDFLGADAGACLVWGIAYSGEIGIEPGEELPTNQELGECASLTPNAVRINRKKGPVSTNGQRRELVGAKLTVSPNPIQTGIARVSLQTKGHRSAGELIIYDGQGRWVAGQHCVANDRPTTLTLDLTTQAPGIYLAVYATPAGRAFTRFIKPR